MNTVSLIGRLTRDPEIRHTGGGTTVASFALAVDRAGDKQDDGTFAAGFFDCNAFGKTAELIEQYVAKGRQLGVTGELRLHKWTSEAGENRQKVEINVRSITFVGSRDENGTAPAATQLPAAADDDIPF